MRIKNIAVFLSFFSVLSRIYRGNSLFCMGKSIFLWQLARLETTGPLTTRHMPASVHVPPWTIFTWTMMRSAGFHFRLPFWGLLLEFLPLFWFCACYLVPVTTFLLIVVFWQVSWLFWSFPSILLLERFSFYVFIFEAFQRIFCPFLILCKVVNLYV